MSILILACLLAICLPVLSVQLPRVQETISRTPLPILFVLFLFFLPFFLFLSPFIVFYLNYRYVRDIIRIRREDILHRERLIT
jgi:hypothetical protein